MRRFLRRWAAGAVVVTLLAACSDGGDDTSSTTTTAPTSSSAVESTTTAATASTSTTAAQDGAGDEQAIRERFREVLEGIPGGQELEPGEEDCLVQEVVADDELRQAMVADRAFADLAPAVQERVVLLAIDCAPRSLARAAVASLELDVDQAALTCLQDGLATDPELLEGLAAVGLTLDDAGAAEEVPTGLVLELLDLVEECGVPFSALS